MASIIIFSNLWIFSSLWGVMEWKGAGRCAGQLLATALFLLVAIVGYRNYLGLAPSRVIWKGLSQVSQKKLLTPLCFPCRL